MSNVDDEIAKQLRGIIVEFLGYLPYSEDSSVESEAESNFEQAITTLIHQAEITRAVVELEKLCEQYCGVCDETTGKSITLKAVTLYRIKARKEALEKEIV